MAEKENQIESKDEAAEYLVHNQSSVEQLVEKTDNLSVSENPASTFTGLKKKKKKQVQIDLLDDEKDNAEEDPVGEDDNGEVIDLQQHKLPWEGTNRDYKYTELLGRVFNNIRENNPDLGGNRKRTVMRPPEVLRVGTKKTVFVNFMDLCKTLHRQPEHAMNFLLTELGASGSLDENQRLTVKGRFASKYFEGILRRYANEYVICTSCKSPETRLEKDKDNRLFFLRCDMCGSEKSVAQIKAGFVARVGRRKAGT